MAEEKRRGSSKKKNIIRRLKLSSRDFNLVVIGILLGQVFFLILESYLYYSNSDKINAIGVVVNVLIGAIIAITIQKKLSDDRGVKDYFIKDLEDVTADYKKLRNNLYTNQCSGRYLLEWFKNTSMKLNHMEEFLASDLGVKNLELQAQNRKIHQILTESTPFANSFKTESNLVLTNKLKGEISLEMNKLKHNIIRAIIEINRA